MADQRQRGRPRTVQNWTVLSQIGSLVGIAPSNTAAQNVTAFNAALDRGNLLVDTAGVYELDDTIFIPSNRTLTFAAGSTLKKKTGSTFSHILVNKGILTRTWNSNIKIIGNGLNIDVNSVDGSQVIVVGMRGHISLFQVDNFEINGIETVSTSIAQFFIHIAEVTNGILKTLNINGWKDAIHCGVMSDIVMEDIITSSGDDGIALNAVDYAVSNPTIGNIERVTIRRWTDEYHASQGGSGMLLLSGSWTNWTTATTYQENDVVINNGRIYQFNQAGTAVSSVAPTHTSGAVTGADGIKWEWKQDGTLNHADVKDITIIDSIWESNRPMVRTLGATDASMRAIFPGTFGQSLVNNIIFDNITITPYATMQMIRIDVNVGNVIVKNTNADLTLTTPVAILSKPIGTYIEKVKFDNCNFNMLSNTIFFSLPVPDGDITFNTLEFNSCNINSPDTTTATIVEGLYADVMKTLIITDTNFDKLAYLISPTSKANLAIDIIANGSSFTGKVKGLVFMYDTTTSIINWNSDNCTFEEPSVYLFQNNQAGSQLNVITTNSLGESIPNLKSGTVNVTASDLVLALGDNILVNGKFRTTAGAWGASTGAILWDASECLKFTASGAGAAGLTCGLLNPLSNNIRLTFKAKSPTKTVKMRSDYNPNSLTAVTNPNMTTDWQTYVFEGNRGAASGTFYILSATNLAAGDIIYFDDITVVQY